MTYKKTQESLDHIHRVASASTRPSARGTIRDIPSWAQAPEDYFNSLHDQLAIKLEHFEQCRKRVEALREQKLADPKLQNKYDFALADMHEVDGEARHLRSLVHAASTNAWGTVFYLCCQKLLDPDVFKHIDDEVRATLKRERKPIPKFGTSERDKAKSRIKTLKRSLTNQKELATKKIERLRAKLRTSTG
jgi:hypothetical protein